jgi:hypothetical protein
MSGRRLLFRRTTEGAAPPAPAVTDIPSAEDAAGEGAPAQVTAEAFGAAGPLTITIQSHGERLVDVLNAPGDPVVRDASGAEIDLDDVLIVPLRERVSDPAKRLHRPGRAVQIRVGPWLVDGSAHAPPAADIMGYWMRYRPHFVVMTQAKLSHASVAGYESHSAILVNLRMADSATGHVSGVDRP